MFEARKQREGGDGVRVHDDRCTRQTNRSGKPAAS
jgi:hypothetical protein